MANSRRNEKSNNLLHLIASSWQWISAIAGLAISLVVMGFKAGAYYNDNKFEIEKFRMEQECNDRIHKLETQLNEAKLEKYQKTVDNLTDVVKQIQQANHEK